jgi:dTDP-glucose 4,6-dehydratase
MTRHALVTGAGGFIGSHLVERLLEEGWQVRALVHYDSSSRWGWLEGLRSRPPAGLKVVSGDVTDPEQTRRAVEGRDTVFHLAALISVAYSYEAARAFVETNTLGTLNLAQAALDAGVSRFILTSTSEVYGSARYTPIDEEHPLQAQSPYAASKVGAEKIVESFARSYGLPAITLRPFNTFGPRQSTRAIVPTIITQALAGPEMQLGSLEPVRDLTFVADTVAGFVAAADAPTEALGRVFNLGSGRGVSIGELVERVGEILGVRPAVRTDPRRVRPAASEVLRLVSDNSRAREILGWSPRVSLDDGLERTIRWIRDHPGKAGSLDYAI